MVSDVIGNRDVIHNHKNKYVCRNEDDFVNAIKQKSTEYAEEAYKDVLDHYEVKGQAKRYAKTYSRVLNGGSKSYRISCYSSYRRVVVV